MLGGSELLLLYRTPITWGRLLHVIRAAQRIMWLRLARSGLPVKWKKNQDITWKSCRDKKIPEKKKFLWRIFFAAFFRIYVRPGNGSISHSGSRPDNGSKISKFGIFALLTSSCWWYSKVGLLYILSSMFVTLRDGNCMFATHNSLMICMNCWASFERRERSRFSEACLMTWLKYPQHKTLTLRKYPYPNPNQTEIPLPKP